MSLSLSETSSSNATSTPNANDSTTQLHSHGKKQASHKKKKRSLGVFPCTHCDKVFSRSDHLARHNLNHEPKEVYVCEFLIDYHGNKTKCGKKFVRKDLKDRHIKRHYEVLNMESTGSTTSPVSAGFVDKRKESTSSSSSSGVPISHLVGEPHLQHQQQDQGLESPKRKIIKLEPSQQYVQAISNHNHSNNQSNVRTPIANLQPDPPTVMYPSSIPSQQTTPKYPTTTQYNMYATNQNNLNQLYKSYGTTIPQNDILTWLFNDSPQGNVLNNSSPESNQIQQVLIPENAPAPPQPPPTIVQPPPPQQPDVQLLPHNIPIPSPYGGSQFSPMADRIQAGAAPTIMPTPPQAGTVPNYAFDMEAFANGYGADVNIFMNDDNPLDEIFQRNYQSLQNQLSGLNKDENGLRSLGLSVSSVSPSNTESSVDNTTEGALQDESKLVQHSEKNLAKNKQYFIDSVLLDDIFGLIGVQLQDLPFETKTSIEDRISFYLYLYWKHFHTQFTFLHKPSFDTKSAELLLLVAMIAVGACYSFPDTAEALAKEYKQSPEFKFTLLLAKPLRFAIFEHEDFKSPVKLWILQSLNMLEWMEKNFLTRRMHERAHLHHGTTVQLLRRSPILGGNPTQKKKSSSNSNSSSAAEEDSELEEGHNTSDTSDRDLFDKWVESESMKRITFMTFYLDIIDYIKFRHNPQILFYQLQLLNLPCDDESLWESNEVNGSFKKVVKRQRKLQDSNGNIKKKKSKTDNFLAALKKLLKSHKLIDVKGKSVFSQKILLAGLISLMHQMQQTELQNSSSLLSTQNSHANNKVWKEMLIRAFDNWYFEVMQDNESSNSAGISMFSLPNRKVPFPIFYLTQIIGLPEVNHYDIAIFAGSPANQSVDATLKDHFIVQQKLNNVWSKNNKNPENIRCIVYCYALLCKLMLDEDGNPLNWNPNCDYYDTINCVSTATLVLWSYCFATAGLESHKYVEQTQNSEALQYAEDGYKYLNRIRESLLEPISGKNSSDAIIKACEKLPLIPNKQNISGLCFLISSKLITSQWEIIREHAKLIFNCGLRSIGKRTILCQDLFTNEFK
ncbi:hypothetical protein Cantr_00297 [Candida viswanathii]|uniref:C2H2-type domain-containing protein n=1 Tax=Candida viswanathii TaxID=5486 RepID=A0A367YI96_9ASCO|nr:hypothetical protein Cantr_00297 [Candida viswanathii]